MGNDLARKRHGAYGKTEMWYILQSNNGARIFAGFSKPVNRTEFLSALEENNIASLLNEESALPGDVFFTPAGTVHAIGSGIVLAEIQTSDITYRISDWAGSTVTAKAGNFIMTWQLMQSTSNLQVITGSEKIPEKTNLLR